MAKQRALEIARLLMQPYRPSSNEIDFFDDILDCHSPSKLWHVCSGLTTYSRQQKHQTRFPTAMSYWRSVMLPGLTATENGSDLRYFTVHTSDGREAICRLPCNTARRPALSRASNTSRTADRTYESTFRSRACANVRSYARTPCT